MSLGGKLQVDHRYSQLLIVVRCVEHVYVLLLNFSPLPVVSIPLTELSLVLILAVFGYVSLHIGADLCLGVIAYNLKTEPGYRFAILIAFSVLEVVTFILFFVYEALVPWAFKTFCLNDYFYSVKKVSDSQNIFKVRRPYSYKAHRPSIGLFVAFHSSPMNFDTLVKQRTANPMERASGWTLLLGAR